MIRNLKASLMAATLLALPAAPALAQDDVKERAAEIAEQANDVQHRPARSPTKSRTRRRPARATAMRARRDARDDGNGSARAADDDDGFDWGLLGCSAWPPARPEAPRRASRRHRYAARHAPLTRRRPISGRPGRTPGRGFFSHERKRKSFRTAR